MRRSPKAAFLREYTLEQEKRGDKPSRSFLHAMPAEHDVSPGEVIRAAEHDVSPGEVIRAAELLHRPRSKSADEEDVYPPLSALRRSGREKSNVRRWVGGLVKRRA